MEKLGVLIVSKCLSATAIIDTLSRSPGYDVEFYVVEKQENPYSVSRANVHAVVPDLDIREVVRVSSRFKGRVAFGLTDTEDFVVGGGRDLMEKEAGIPMVCVSKRYAVEGSKAAQRRLFERIFPEANPVHSVFEPSEFAGEAEAVAEFRRIIDELGAPVVKPDAPARGAGVGVWGSDFSTKEDAVRFFRNVYSKGSVVVEEKVEGEESSFHAFSDGKHFIPAPMTRDYKRCRDGNQGSLTGGMGSYRAPSMQLPFVREADWARLAEAEERAFRKWKGRGSDPGLRGIVLYDAIMHTGTGFKVLERNSRGGNTESVNILTTIADDFAEVCLKMVEGRLKGIRFSRRASVVTCAVPLSYGEPSAPQVAGSRVVLDPANAVAARSRGLVRAYPMDINSKGAINVIGSSRAVAAVGLGETLEGARLASQKCVRSLQGPLKWRSDIASSEDIRRSRAHLARIRAGA